MLKFQLQNTESWKEELQDGLKKADIGPQTRALIMHFINCFTNENDYRYNISSDYNAVYQAVCFNQHILGLKHFLQVKLLQDWMDIL